MLSSYLGAPLLTTVPSKPPPPAERGGPLKAAVHGAGRAVAVDLAGLLGLLGGLGPPLPQPSGCPEGLAWLGSNPPTMPTHQGRCPGVSG